MAPCLVGSIAAVAMFVNMHGHCLIGFGGNAELELHFHFTIIILFKPGGTVYGGVGISTRYGRYCLGVIVAACVAGSGSVLPRATRTGTFGTTGKITCNDQTATGYEKMKDSLFHTNFYSVACK